MLTVTQLKKQTLLTLFILFVTTHHHSLTPNPSERLKVKLNFKLQNNGIYNTDFNLDELAEAIQLSHDSAMGPDEIYYQMLKHLLEKSLKTLLNIFNYIWTSGKFPKDWK